MPPSPTGFLHLGNARTMLYNWLFARGRGGRVVLRFEDTDTARSTEEAIAQAEQVLRWLGLDWDDGPHRQTHRFELYRAAVDELIVRGAAYRCYCTDDELAAERARRQAQGLPLVYNGRCRTRPDSERAALEAAGAPSVVRLAVPETGATASYDDHTTFMTRGELVERFMLERVNRSPGVFDPEKLEWLNGEHLRAMPEPRFAETLQLFLESAGSPLAGRPERVAQAAPLVHEK